MVNTGTQRIITGEMGTVISAVSGRAYTISVMAVVDDSQRSELGKESVTAGGCRGYISICVVTCMYSMYVCINKLRHFLQQK